jgi:hypothetical protein
MSPANRFTLPLALLGFVFLAGCGNNNNGPAPNQQGFTASNLTGTYVFFSQGFDTGVNNGGAAAPLTIAGAFAADGSGHITGGTMDALDPVLGMDPGQAITSGSYFVNSDGRGQAQLVTGIGTFVLDFVLTAGTTGVSSHGLVTEFDSAGSGSGTLDLQTAVPSQSSIAGPFAFNIAGSDGGGNSFASTGAFTLDSSGTITAGVQDFNDNGLPTLDQSLTGNAVVGSGTAPGTITLSSGLGALAFHFYPIDATHFKIVEIDALEYLEGDAFTQNGASIPNGPMVFTMSGGLSTAVGTGGVMTSDGTGNFPSGLEDYNNQGVVPPQQLAFSGSNVSSGPVGGRVVVNLTGFSPATQWVIYPSSGGLQILESDALNTMNGTAYAQTTGATLSTTQGYGLNLSAFDFQDVIVENSIAEFASTNSAYTGGIDINDDLIGQGSSLSPNLPFAVTFTGPDSTGRGTATTTAQGSAYIGFDYYLVDDSNALFLETDNIQVGTGVFGLQTSAGSGVMRNGSLARAHPQVGAKVPKSGKEVKRQTKYN